MTRVEREREQKTEGLEHVSREVCVCLGILDPLPILPSLLSPSSLHLPSAGGSSGGTETCLQETAVSTAGGDSGQGNTDCTDN